MGLISSITTTRRKEINSYLQRDLEAVHSNLEAETQEAYHWKETVAHREASLEENQALQVGMVDELVSSALMVVHSTRFIGLTSSEVWRWRSKWHRTRWTETGRRGTKVLGTESKSAWWRPSTFISGCNLVDDVLRLVVS